MSSTHKICTPLWDRTRDLSTHPSTLPSPQHILRLCQALNTFFNSAKPSTHSTLPALDTFFTSAKPSTHSTLPALDTFFTSTKPSTHSTLPALDTFFTSTKPSTHSTLPALNTLFTSAKPSTHSSPLPALNAGRWLYRKHSLAGDYRTQNAFDMRGGLWKRRYQTGNPHTPRFNTCTSLCHVCKGLAPVPRYQTSHQISFFLTYHGIKIPQAFIFSTTKSWQATFLTSSEHDYIWNIIVQVKTVGLPMVQFQNKSWLFIRSPFKLESSFRDMHNKSIATIKTMCCTVPHRLYTLTQFLFHSQSCCSHKTTPYMIAAKRDTRDQCEMHRANVIHMANVKYTQPICDTHGQCEIQPMWNTHGQCEIHTANVRYTRPMRDTRSPCEIHTANAFIKAAHSKWVYRMFDIHQLAQFSSNFFCERVTSQVDLYCV